MAQSIATLGVKVTTDGVQQADAQLAHLTQTGAKTEQQAVKTAAAMQKTSISAAQLTQATRQLPMQFTDIFTGLSSGQAPMQVLIQQGGQLKDSFGGIGPAARAMGGYVMGLINPLSLAAAASLALVAAWKQGSDEAIAFNRALIMTGNYAAMSAGQFRELQQEMDGIAGVTGREAAEAMTAVAATGRITGDAFDNVSKAVAVWSETTGQKVDDVVATFVKLSKDPVNAILELNESQHFLTEATFEQINSLKEQGRETDAARLAMETYAGVLLDRAPKITQNLGALETGWKVIKETAAEAWDAMLGIGREQTVADRIASLQEQIARAQARGFDTASLEAGLRQLQSMPDFSDVTSFAGASAAESAKLRADAKAREDAARDFQRYTLENLSKQEKLEQEIASIRAAGRLSGQSEAAIETAIANARARYAESLKKTRTPKAKNEAVDSFPGLQMFSDAASSAFGANSFLSGGAGFESGFAGMDKFMPAAQRNMTEFGAGWETTLDNVAANFEGMANTGEQAMDDLTVFAEQAGRNMQDAFADFLFDPLEGGFEGLLENFSDVLRRMAAEFAASELMQSIGKWGQQNQGGEGWMGALANIASSMFGAKKNANGNVYSSPSLHSYANGVYTSPRMFAFANGGVFAEAGPEAIMPLTRTAGGQLGVKAVGGSNLNVKVEVVNRGGNLQVESQDTQRNADGSVLVRLIANTVNGGIASGQFDRSMGQAFGVRRAGMSRG